MEFKILEIDLNSQEINIREISEKKIENYLGGRGLGAKLLHEEIKENPKINPLSEKNPVIISTSPFTGYFPSANRTWVTTLSPLTNYYTTSSGGSHFAGELAKNGYIVIKITGKSERPVHIEINGEKIEIKNTEEEYWGKKVYDLIEDAREKGYEPLSIGPAAEKGVKYAGTFPGYRSCSRGGTGAVLGYKKLKTILVKKGKKELEIPNNLKEIINEKFKEVANEREPRQKTLPLVEKVNKAESYPTNNWKKSKFKDASKTGLKTLKKHIVKTKSCFKCPIGCQDVMKSKYTGKGDGVEYEIAWALGANLENKDEEIIIAANHLCDQYGLDVLNTAGAIAWAKEASEKGLIDYKWKGKESILELTKKIGKREGIGKVLGEGSRKAHEKYSKKDEDFSIDVRRMNLPAYDPRGLRGMSLTYSQGPRYGCHLKSWTAGMELGQKTEERTSPKGKPEISYEIMIKRIITDSTSICSFVNSYSREDYAEIYSKILGKEITMEKLKKRAHEIQKLERKIDIERGINKENDILPKRVLEKPVEINGEKVKIGKKQLEKMNKELYKLREI